MAVRRIEVEIDELVLHGFDAKDRYRVGEAFERELTRLLAADPHAPLPHDAIERIVAGTVHVGNGARREELGTAVARSVHASLSRARARGESSGIGSTASERESS